MPDGRGSPVENRNPRAKQRVGREDCVKRCAVAKDNLSGSERALRRCGAGGTGKAGYGGGRKLEKNEAGSRGRVRGLITGERQKTVTRPLGGERSAFLRKARAARGCLRRPTDRWSGRRRREARASEGKALGTLFDAHLCRVWAAITENTPDSAHIQAKPWRYAASVRII